MSNQRLLIVTPARNEADHIERVARAMAAQSVRPDRWIVVDDRSTDDTAAILERLRLELPFLHVVDGPPPAGPTRDRLASAAAPRAFNHGLRASGSGRYDFVGKLDADIELPADYFESLLGEFDADPSLGIAGGTLVERSAGGDWREAPAASDHVRGALKLYRGACFAAIGGMREQLGWDGFDETMARMRGWRTHSFGHLVARHHRVTGSADGKLRGHARWGAGHYILHFSPLWVLARSLRHASAAPRGLSGAAYLYGYARAAVRRTPRAGDAEYRRFVRRELRGRLLQMPMQVVRRVNRSSDAAAIPGRAIS